MSAHSVKRLSILSNAWKPFIDVIKVGPKALGQVPTSKVRHLFWVLYFEYYN